MLGPHSGHLLDHPGNGYTKIKEIVVFLSIYWQQFTFKCFWKLLDQQLPNLYSPTSTTLSFPACSVREVTPAPPCPTRHNIIKTPQICITVQYNTRP